MEQSVTENPNLISFLTLRRWIGILGIGLPWACWIANGVINGLDLLNNPKLTTLPSGFTYQPESNIKSSISHFYYTASAPLFIGVLITVAIFLFSYKGYPPKKDEKFPFITDNLITSLAAIFALGIAIFPTGSSAPISDNLFIFTAAPLLGTVHYLSAALFFILMAILCLVNFRRKGLLASFGRSSVDWVYVTCGWTILASLLLIALFSFVWKDLIPSHWPTTFILEAVALTAFGAAWLVKGKIKEVSIFRSMSS